MAIAAASLTRVALELGGNDPVLILRDAELGPAALHRLCGAVSASTGQICMAAKPLYVHSSRYDEVVTGLPSGRPASASATDWTRTPPWGRCTSGPNGTSSQAW